MECKMEFKAVKFAKTALKGAAIRQSRTSSAEQCRLVALWQSSGIKQRAFCKEHNLNPKTFSSWVRQGRKREQDYPSTAEKELIKQEAANNQVEIRLPNGTLFRFHGGIDLQQLNWFLQGNEK